MLVVFSPDELETALRPVFDAVWNQDVESFPFQQAVDPIRLGIPVSALTTMHKVRTQYVDWVFYHLGLL